MEMDYHLRTLCWRSLRYERNVVHSLMCECEPPRDGSILLTLCQECVSLTEQLERQRLKYKTRAASRGGQPPAQEVTR